MTHDASGEDFEPYFYTNFLRSLRAPRRPEARLIELHPSFDTVRVTVSALIERGLLLARDARWPQCRLNKEILGDEEALSALPDSETAESRSARTAWLRARVLDGNATDVVAYAELGPSDLDEVLEPQGQTPLGSVQLGSPRGGSPGPRPRRRGTHVGNRGSCAGASQGRSDASD